MSSHGRANRSWGARTSWPDPEDLERPSSNEPIPGDPLRTALSAGGAGALGGVLALLCAGAFRDLGGLVAEVRLAFGAATAVTGVTAGGVWLRVGASLVAGALVGALMGVLTRRLHGRFARIVFGAVLLPSLWIALDAFALSRFAPGIAALVPFLPGLLGALVFGISVALVRPIAPAWAHATPFAPANGTASFLLVRRRA